MKYKIGDKVRIRRDLVAGKGYYTGHSKDTDNYTFGMDELVKNHDYVLTIAKYANNDTEYEMLESDRFWWTESMIEGLAETTDREKFEEWMRKLSSLDGYDERWEAFNNCVTLEPDEKGYEDNLKIISDYLFGKKMTKAEIEAELGYDIEIVGE